MDQTEIYLKKEFRTKSWKQCWGRVFSFYSWRHHYANSDPKEWIEFKRFNWHLEICLHDQHSKLLSSRATKKKKKVLKVFHMDNYKTQNPLYVILEVATALLLFYCNCFCYSNFWSENKSQSFIFCYHSQ